MLFELFREVCQLLNVNDNRDFYIPARGLRRLSLQLAGVVNQNSRRFYKRFGQQV